MFYADVRKHKKLDEFYTEWTDKNVNEDCNNNLQIRF